ncbi:MAG: hypothetical protein WD646_13370 [Actinomycetota bacterium]
MELYEALKGPVGEKAARMIAEIVPVAADVARKQHVAEAVATLSREIADVRVEVRASNTRTIQWILGVTIPLWIGTWGMMAAILLRSA